MEAEKTEKKKEEEPPYILPVKHIKAAIRICRKHITKRFRKKGCKVCKLLGYVGLSNPNRFVIPCHMCCDSFSAREEFKKYCLDFPVLKKMFVTDVEVAKNASAGSK